ncbi:MAG: hypothetical protein ETSY2_45360 [Candidatus Entotheonella gemina]|uniref:Uncharacterized protein n=1 Tax=Candidatus Entotheonella gemina TaxID=1429439 RepID=W4LG98_9BACT|nr:MAG: hypothetical protein ETSY2_45360 [Candidatus Entotheonella gemina]
MANADQISRIYDALIDAALAQNWSQCNTLREELRRVAPERVNRPYTPDCSRPGRSGEAPSHQPATEPHRFMYSSVWGEDRCIYCHCERER